MLVPSSLITSVFKLPCAYIVTELKKRIISEEHYGKVQRNVNLRSLAVRGELTSRNISLSGDFSDVNEALIMEKANLLGLDNIELVAGPFDITMTKIQEEPESIIAALIDCDLYMSYKAALPFVWSRLSLGGYIWLDEYYSLKFPGARIATDEFFADKADKPQRHKMIPGDFERWLVRRIHDL